VFFRIHRHEEIPHGAQVLDAADEAAFTEGQWGDLLEGAKKGRELYMSQASAALKVVGN
jgi:hypothetical protein